MLKIKNIEIGSGIPKICVPLVGRSKEEVIDEIEAASEKNIQILEWRADFFGDEFQIEEIIDFLPYIKERCAKKILLFTFRSSQEGGKRSIDPEQYFWLNKAVIESKLVDMVDIELFSGDDVLKPLVHAANNNFIPILMSNHDFESTPSKETMIKRFCKMQDLGADISKIAVMSNSIRDVSELIGVMVEMEECYADKPFIAVAMSKIGILSRICGEMFGSAITFGSMKKSSAPGQIEVDDLDQILKLLHKYS